MRALTASSAGEVGALASRAAAIWYSPMAASAPARAERNEPGGPPPSGGVAWVARRPIARRRMVSEGAEVGSRAISAST